MALSMEDTSYKLVKSEVRDLTPELAEEFRNLDPSPTERELNPARIRHLKIKAGFRGQAPGRLWKSASSSYHQAPRLMSSPRNERAAIRGLRRLGTRRRFPTVDHLQTRLQAQRRL